jgi:hypothetical protein
VTRRLTPSQRALRQQLRRARPLRPRVGLVEIDARWLCEAVRAAEPAPARIIFRDIGGAQALEAVLGIPAAGERLREAGVDETSSAADVIAKTIARFNNAITWLRERGIAIVAHVTDSEVLFVYADVPTAGVPFEAPTARRTSENTERPVAAPESSGALEAATPDESVDTLSPATPDARIAAAHAIDGGGSGRPPTTTAMVDHARCWAGLGYHVFALKPRTKIPHAGSRGLWDATRDERKILHAWDDRRAASNIGVSPAPSGAFIVDIDSKHGADPEDVLTDLDLDIAGLPIIWTAAAPEPCDEYPHSLAGVRGGQVWFSGQAPTGKTPIKGVEIRGKGAYGLLPPSVHPWGDRYEGNLPPAARLPAPPEAIVELVNSAAAAAVSTPILDGTVFDQGTRHEQLLAWARSRYTAHGVLGEAAWLGMLGKNRVSCRPPLEEHEVRRLWRHLENTRIAKSERAVARLIAGWQENRR